MIKKYFLSILRWGLRLHGILHLAEVIAAIADNAWPAAAIGTFAMTIEILASFYIPKEHIHFRPIKSDVHEECDD